MTRTRDEIEQCLDLGREGLNPTEVAKLTGVPRATVRDWFQGRTPVARAQEAGDWCARCGSCHALEELPPEYVYLLGIYLGDGCISAHPRGVYRLRVFLDAKYPRIIAEVAETMGAVRSKNTVAIAPRPNNCFEVSSYSKSWPCLFPQHGRGKKHERAIFLADWQRHLVEHRPHLLLRGLIHSDGCRFINTGRGGWRHPRYTFCSLSSGIRTIFCDACDLLDLHWTYAKPKQLYVSRKADVARMDEFIGPKT